MIDVRINYKEMSLAMGADGAKQLDDASALFIDHAVIFGVGVYYGKKYLGDAVLTYCYKTHHMSVELEPCEGVSIDSFIAVKGLLEEWCNRTFIEFDHLNFHIQL